MTADRNKIINDMDQTELNRNLKEVIKQAQDINIPVPADICEQVEINSRPKKRYGCCRLKNGVYHIEVSEFILGCDPEKIRGVLAHEILHTCKGCYNHGNMWKRYASMMNSAYGYNIKLFGLYLSVTGKSSPHVLFISCTISRANRSLFSRLPPYSSVL